jgi:hypothetical protein
MTASSEVGWLATKKLTINKTAVSKRIKIFSMQLLSPDFGFIRWVNPKETYLTYFQNKCSKQILPTRLILG